MHSYAPDEASMPEGNLCCLFPGVREPLFDCDLFAHVGLSFATFYVTRGRIEVRVHEIWMAAEIVSEERRAFPI